MFRPKMQPEQAAILLNLQGEFTLTDIKRNFREMAAIYHPDKNSSPTATAMMQSLNTAREVLESNIGKYYKAPVHKYGANKGESINLGEQLNKAIELLDAIPDLDLFVKGTWLWIEGANEKHYPILKEAGCKIHKTKSTFVGGVELADWYLGQRTSRGRGRMSKDRIDSIHGSSRVGKRARVAISA